MKNSTRGFRYIEAREKTAEGYFTLQGVLKLIAGKEGFKEEKNVASILF